MEAENTEDIMNQGFAGLRRSVRSKMYQITVILVFIAEIIIFGALSPKILTVGNFSNILLQNSILIITALAVQLSILQGSIDISFVGISASAATIIVALNSRRPPFTMFPFPIVDFPTWVVLIIGIAFGALVGLINGVLIAKVRLPSLIVTLGTGLGLWYGLSSTITQGVPLPVKYEALLTLGNAKIGPMPYIGIIAIAVTLLMFFLLEYTPFGRYIYAIGGDETIARLSGIPISRVKILSYTLAGAIFGFAGCLLAGRLSVAYPDMSQPYLLDSLLAVCIGGTGLTGGVGSAQRTFLGALIIGLLSNALNILGVNYFAQIIIKGAMFILAISFTFDRSKILVIK